MHRLTNLLMPLTLGAAIAAVHFVVTAGSLIAIGLSAVGGGGTRIPLFILEWILQVCVFPVVLLPVDLSQGWLLLNSALWGFSLVALARWLLSRRKPRLAS